MTLESAGEASCSEGGSDMGCETSWDIEDCAMGESGDSGLGDEDIELPLIKLDRRI